MIHRHKFNAVRTEINGIKFPSKLEARYYKQLLLRQQMGEVLFFLMQTPFRLTGGIIYRIDFQEFRSDGTVHFIDCKGKATDVFIMKKKMVEELYPIKIEIVTKV